MPTSQQELLRALPAIDDVLRTAAAHRLAARLPRERVVDLARAAVDEVRTAVREGRAAKAEDAGLAAVEEALERAAHSQQQPSLRRVVNATGVVLHTNLGRSPLADAAVAAVADVARGYSTLEYDVEARCRGSRHDHCERLLCALTGAEAAIAVNNNAAAVMLVLAEFARGRAAIVSRGELVEIGGSFRVPDIMDASSARMVEVGTTNKTHVADYERALSPDVAMLLKVHPSNFRTVGFTESVSVRSMRAVADAENERRAAAGDAANRVLVYEDLGSGCLVRLDCFGEEAEPTVRESLAQGADLVSFSGDKLLGGPQAGIVAGSRELIGRLKRNPLVRAMRLDKMTLAALEATLRLYVDERRAREEVPALRMLCAPTEALRAPADALAARVRDALTQAGPAEAGAAGGEAWASVDVVEDVSAAGGGSLPLCELGTFCVRVTFAGGEDEAGACERYLSSGRDVPVVCRRRKGAVLFDVRTLLAGDDDEVAAACAEYFALAAADGGDAADGRAGASKKGA